jgi:histidinol phosphatase-like enzyme (inositol monophosphatase family)
MSDRDLQDELAFAHRLADAAGAAILPHFRNLSAVENKLKTGFDPVTIADRAAETAMRDLIVAHRPLDGILGEEFPSRPSRNGWSWTLDPIDGTRGFIAGTPVWCVLIALTFEDRPVLGLIAQPYINERFSGFAEIAELITGHRKTRLRASSVDDLSYAILATTDSHLFEDDEAEQFARLRKAVRLTRYGMDAYAYALVAAGGIDLVVETGLGLHDIHALVPVVRAAGGTITDWSGGQDYTTGRLIAAATPALHQQAISVLVG